MGVAPELVMVKTAGSTNSWAVFHHSNTSAPATDYLFLDTNAATADDAGYWNDTAPTQYNVVLGGTGNTNGTGGDNPIMGFCFAGKQGFSKFGKYTGNGNDPNGPFVHLGFSPAWVMIKRTDSSDNWKIHTKKVEVFNPINQSVSADTNGAEAAEADHEIDFLSNGFKLKENNSAFNASGGTYIYAAFAEAPFVNSNGVPCNAR